MIKMKAAAVSLALLAALCLSTGPARAATYSVSPSGASAPNDADRSSIDQAFGILKAGDVLYFHGGDYYPTMDNGIYNNLTLSGRSGNAAQWITPKNAPGEHPVLHLGIPNGYSGSTCFFIGRDCSFIRVEGLELAGNPGNNLTGLGGGAHDIQLVNNVVHDFGAAGIGGGGPGSGSQELIEDNTVYNCCGNVHFGPSGISVYEPTLLTSDNSHFGGALGNPNNQYSLIIRNNTCYNNVERLLAQDTHPFQYTDGNGIIIDDFDETQGNNPAGPYPGRTLVANNVCYANGGAGVHVFNSSHVDAFNNTCWHNSRNANGSELDSYGGKSHDNRLSSNVCVPSGATIYPKPAYSDPNNPDATITDRGPGRQTIGSSNLDDGSGTVVWSDNLYFNTSAYVAGSGSVADPSFLSPGVGGSANFHPAAGSPAASGGSGLGPSYDHDGVPRASATEIGAYTPAVSGGALTGSWAAPSGTVTLSGSQGARDWAHWGLSSAASFDHRRGANKISSFTKIGAATPAHYPNNPVGYSWTGGTPTPSATNTTTGVYVAGVGNGFSVTAPADTTQRTLRVYVGVWLAGGRLTAHLSDGSAADFTDASLSSGSGPSGRVYALTYKAAKAGQKLTVTWTQASGSGNVTLQAAALQ